MTHKGRVFNKIMEGDVSEPREKAMPSPAFQRGGKREASREGEERRRRHGPAGEECTTSLLWSCVLSEDKRRERTYLRGVPFRRRHVGQRQVEDGLPPRGALLAHVRRDAVRQREHGRDLAPRGRESAERGGPARLRERARPGGGGRRRLWHFFLWTPL